jgi:adenylate cyclase class 2
VKPQPETEIKLAVRNARALKRRLRSLGFQRVQPRYFESNALFDFPDARLRNARCLLRLRRIGKQWLLTFKGAPRPSQRFKIRGEIETEVANGVRLRQILEALGLREAFRYEKFRTVYAPAVPPRSVKRPQLLLDETPIGTFLELEGPPRWIDTVAVRLGFGREDYIIASYATLYRLKCQELGTEPGHMVFATQKS